MTRIVLVLGLATLLAAGDSVALAGPAHLVGPAVRGGEVTLFGSEQAAAEGEPAGSTVPGASVARAPILRVTADAYQVSIGGRTWWVNRGDVIADDEQRRPCTRGAGTHLDVAASRGLGDCP
ncbi:MAG: hypothetical protein KIT14_22085 [bacterium]|nr:hypothetical protein [bacterium]